MITFAERLDSFLNAQRNYTNSLVTKGYYTDNSTIRWEPACPEEVEPEKRFGPGACTVGELDNYDWRDCEEF